MYMHSNRTMLTEQFWAKVTSGLELTINLLPGRLHHWVSSELFIVCGWNYYDPYLKAKSENQKFVVPKFLIWSTLHADIKIINILYTKLFPGLIIIYITITRDKPHTTVIKPAVDNTYKCCRSRKCIWGHIPMHCHLYLFFPTCLIWGNKYHIHVSIETAFWSMAYHHAD